MRFRMEAAGIEPVSDDRTETQKGNWTYQALMRAKRIREQSRTGPTDDDPRSQRGPSGSTATPSGGAAMSRRAQRKAEARRRPCARTGSRSIFATGEGVTTAAVRWGWALSTEDMSVVRGDLGAGEVGETA
jgi:hypothetical protein